MKKFFTFCAAMLVAFAVNADPVVLPAVLDTSNVSFRSANMPNFVLASGDYAGTYFDMGAHDVATDTLLYAQWDVTMQPATYNVAVVVYNENSWRVQLDILNQSDQVVKAIRYKGSSGQCGQYSIGSIDMSDLAAGNYKVRVHAATAWSKMKLRDVIFEANYSGVSVDLPGTLEPTYAVLSSGATIANGAIAFAPETAPNEYAIWNVSFAEAGLYNVSIDYTADNGHTYGVALLSADGETQISAVAEAQAWDTGVKKLGAISVATAGNYKVKLTNATKWSEAVLNSITVIPVYTVAGSAALCGVEWLNNEASNDMTYSENAFRWSSGPVYYNGTATWEFKIAANHTWDEHAYPSTNYSIHSGYKLESGAGYYNVDIAYVPEGNDRITVTATYLGPKVELKASFLNNNWDPVEMTPSSNGEYLKYTCNVAAGVHNGSNGFMISVGGGSWVGYMNTVTRDNCVNWTLNSTTNTCGLQADLAGSYEIRYEFADGKVDVIYPILSRAAAGNTNYQTLCTPYDAVLVGATAYTVSSANASAVNITSVEGNLEAGRAYIIKPDAADSKITLTYDNTRGVSSTTLTPEDHGGNFGLYGQLQGDFELSFSDSWKNNYILLASDNLFHEIVTGGSATIGATKAYLHIPGVGIGAPALRIIEGPAEATNINNIEANEEAVKFFQNGKLFIKKNGVVYDMMGAVVK